MLTDQHRMEALSRAYVAAIAAEAGISTGKDEHDYGVDGTFRYITRRENLRRGAGFTIDFQLKSSTRWSLSRDGHFIVYPLETKTYNDLVERAQEPSTTPLILILFCVPGSLENCLELDEERLILRKCCYWHQLSGATKQTRSKETSIKIPRHQLLTPGVLTDLLEKVKKGEPLL